MAVENTKVKTISLGHKGGAKDDRLAQERAAAKLPRSVDWCESEL